MSDVILYAAVKENQKLTAELASASSTGVGLSYFQSPQTAGYPYVSSSSYDPLNPPMVQSWKCYLTPLVKTGSSGFKVCDTSGYYRCGAGCTWTVPAGVTRVQFQIWGPGGGTSSNCCCGGAPFGPSGAYSVVQMNVTAGEIYCLCAGCAYCCCASQTTPGICGTPSYVTGPGLCFCADSGQSCYCYWNADIASGTCGCAIPAVGIGGSDACAAHGCGGWNFCWDTSQDDTTVCHAFSRATWRVSCKDTGRNFVCYGINGLYPHMRIGSGDLNNGGACSISTPVFGFESCVCTEFWNSGGTCFGQCRQAQLGFLQIPGAGGYATRVFGGCNACGGDHGRMGMVCVSWGGI